jgi:Tfp pilus assembly protein PilF
MFAKGVNLAQAGQLDEAAAIFEEIDQAHPGILEVYRNLGFISVRQENWARAEASFLAALELRPGDPDFVAALVKVYEESGQEEKARELVSQTASANPGDGTAQYNQGIFLLKEGKSEEAMGAFEAALAADPPAMEAHYYLGTLLVGQGQVPEAIEHLEAYVASEPPNPQNLATAQGLLEALKQQ